jgi:MtN3 and saliva related transmembrane protein
MYYVRIANPVPETKDRLSSSRSLALQLTFLYILNVKMKGLKMKRIEILGILAGICTTSAFVPQVFTVWNMRPVPATSISLPMYVMFTIGVLGWAFYGVKIKSQSIIIMNSVTSMLALSILIYKCIYG